ncbi:hypothetical protein B0T22DRAFT_440661 [Podospora appendiculata]|uniref:ABM domain-containing protein n=1 Tax=Podospora appendiculata TaxID=314037 RepID=A0AAE0XAN2_9PEZI|nr:hypothetical protein B0T22DRAFT_440661 [Podospora appendiculata]
MGQHLLITKYLMVDTPARDKLLDIMINISKSVAVNEPDVLRYALLVPSDDDDRRTMYSIEEYTDDPAFQAHLATSGVKDMFAWVGSSPGQVFAPVGGVTCDRLDVTADVLALGLVRPSFPGYPDPCIVVEKVEYENGKIKDTLRDWRVAVEAARGKEDGTLMFGVYPYHHDAFKEKGEGDTVSSEKLFVVGAYESEEHWREVHGREESVEGRAGLERVVLKMKGGFLLRSDDAGSG